MVSGGIGVGKSAVGDALARRGVTVIDADHVGHEVLAPGSPAADEVGRRWPEVVDAGVVDRRALGRVVFADAEALEALESITHGAIRDEIGRRIEGVAGLVAVEIPLLRDLMGDGWLRVVVDAPEEVRIERLRRRGLDNDEIEARMASQPSRAEWLAAADLVIDNSGELADLEPQIDRLIEVVEGSRTRPADSANRPG